MSVHIIFTQITAHLNIPLQHRILSNHRLWFLVRLVQWQHSDMILQCLKITPVLIQFSLSENYFQQYSVLGCIGLKKCDRLPSAEEKILTRTSTLKRWMEQLSTITMSPGSRAGNPLSETLFAAWILFWVKQFFSRFAQSNLFLFIREAKFFFFYY